MPDRTVRRLVIADTSPLVFLSHAGALGLLDQLFGEVWLPRAVEDELEAGARLGHHGVDVTRISRLHRVETGPPPSEWRALDLGPGELAAMTVAAQTPEAVVLLDDALARRVGQAAGLEVWGTLRVLLEGKAAGHVDRVAPTLDRLVAAGMYFTDDLRRRVLTLAGEA